MAKEYQTPPPSERPGGPTSTNPASASDHPATRADRVEVSPERPAAAEAERRTAVGCAWWWWLVMLLVLAVLIWLSWGAWRTTPPPAAPGPTLDQPPITSPTEPPTPPPSDQGP